MGRAVMPGGISTREGRMDDNPRETEIAPVRKGLRARSAFRYPPPVALLLATLSLASLPTGPTLAEPGAPTRSPASSPHAQEVAPMSASWQSWNPNADPRAVFVEGNARFIILTPRLVRLEWSADGTFEDRSSLVFVHRRLAPPAVSVAREAGWLVLDTGALRLCYRPCAGPFTEENLEVSFHCEGCAGARSGDPAPAGLPPGAASGGTVAWRPGLCDTLNLKGTTRTLDSTNGAVDVRLEDGLLSRSGWALIDDSARPLFDSGDPPWVLPRPPGERQDWYLFAHGLDYRGALGDFNKVSGRIPLPPRFALGYWWSRYWAYADDELRALVAEIRGHGIPLDVLVVDMDWHTTEGLSSLHTRRDGAGQMVGWTGYTFNRDLFPDPPAFLAWAHAQGLHVTLNLHPASGVPATEERYAAFARALGLDAASNRTIAYALEDRRWGEAFFETILRPLEEQGVDFWWLDWQAWRLNPRVPHLDETFWLNHVFFSMAERRAGSRPLLLHRWGGLGNHRYQIGFSGDSFSTWDALAFQPQFTATAANVGYGWWSHDIGGHQGEDPDPELYLRWLQFGALSPVLRTHSTKNLAIERRIWRYPDEFEAMRTAIQLRYALVPYLYTAARDAHDTGVSVCRPMYYDHPLQPEAYAATQEYMLGDDLLAVPVTVKARPATGLAEVRIWLPPGGWFEWGSGAHIDGGPRGTWMTRSYTRSEIPLFARAGSVVPLYPPMPSLASVPDTLILACMPSGGAGGEQTRGQGRLYEDDGSTTAYLAGACAWTDFLQREAGGVRTVRIAPRQGSYRGMAARRAYEIRLVGTFPPRSVQVNGRSYARANGGSSPAPETWVYDGATLTACIFTSPLTTDAEVVAEALLPSESAVEVQLLDGAAGQMARLAEDLPRIKAEWNRFDAIANPPAPLLNAGSAARRITAEPERTAEILRELQATLVAALDSLAVCPARDPMVLKGIAARIAPPGLQPEPPCIRFESAPEIPTGLAEPCAHALIEAPPEVHVVYTLDGTMPAATSARYTAPIPLTRTMAVRARAFRGAGRAGSFPAEAVFHRRFAARLSTQEPPSAKYAPAFALTDGLFGRDDDFREGWCGWEGDDLVVTIDLPDGAEVRGARIRFLRDQRNWIFFPAHVRFDIAAAGDDAWETVYASGDRAAAEHREEAVGVRVHTASFAPRRAARLRIVAENVGTVPAWHRGAGGRAWVFADEIAVE